MDLSLGEDLELFRSSVQRFVATEISFDSRKRRLLGDLDPYKPWKSFADLGWLGLGIGERDGGVGGGILEHAIVQEELGRALAIEPYLGSQIFPSRLLQRGDDDVRQRHLQSIASGEARFAVAWMETAARYSPADIHARAIATDGGYLLSGSKILVMGGGEADQMIVSAVIDEGVALFIVPSSHPGLDRRCYRGIDGTAFADIAFTDLQVGPDALLVDGHGGCEALEAALDHVRVAYCAALVGAMSAAVDITRDYVKIRKQFGRPLADFQVVQHRLVDMLIDTEQSRAGLLGGMAGLPKGPGARSRDVSACMVHVLEAMRKVTGMAVHQHGGIGHTQEAPIGHYYCLSIVSDKLFGDVPYHLSRFMSVEYADYSSRTTSCARD